MKEDLRAICDTAKAKKGVCGDADAETDSEIEELVGGADEQSLSATGLAS